MNSPLSKTAGRHRGTQPQSRPLRGALPDHIDKLLAHPDVEERHLFLVIHESALTFELSDALATGRTMPLEPPPLPHGVTHLWLAHHFSRRVLLGAAGGWSEHYPYDG
jgi:hypothetical protein